MKAFTVLVDNVACHSQLLHEKVVSLPHSSLSISVLRCDLNHYWTTVVYIVCKYSKMRIMIIQ